MSFTPPTDHGRASFAGLHGYHDLQLIAHGSTAMVFRGVQSRLNRLVAIKVLLVDNVMTTEATVARELETTVALSSQPHIVSIIDTGHTDDGSPFIVMEYCDGGSYAQILRQRGPLSLGEVLEVGIKIGEALQAAHDVGIVHRDVKPPNILRSRFGPALTDFGIARAADDGGQATGTLDKLTPQHASPEAMLREPQSGLSDLYSLASTMWNLLAGRPPFADPRMQRQDPFAFRERVLIDPPPRVPRADVPEWLQLALLRALAKSPSDRHAGARHFAETLRLEGREPSVVITSLPRPPMPAVTPPAPPPPQPGGLWPDPPTGGRPPSPDVNEDPAEVTELVAPSTTPEPAIAAPVLSAPPPDYARSIAPAIPQSWPVSTPPSTTLPAPAPDPRWSPPSAKRSLRWPLLGAAVVGIVLGLVITTAVLLNRDPGNDSHDSRGTTASPSLATPSPTGSISLTADGAPTGLQIQDDGGTVTVTWIDSTSGAAPFLIFGARTGQQTKVLARQDPGATSATINGLSAKADYCFVVAAVVAADTLANSDPICTRRLGQPAPSRS